MNFILIFVLLMIMNHSYIKKLIVKIIKYHMVIFALKFAIFKFMYFDN